MPFKTKSIEKVGAWLNEGFSDEVVHLFKENEVDGEAFLLHEKVCQWEGH